MVSFGANVNKVKVNMVKAGTHAGNERKEESVPKAGSPYVNQERSNTPHPSLPTTVDRVIILILRIMD